MTAKVGHMVRPGGVIFVASSLRETCYVVPFDAGVKMTIVQQCALRAYMRKASAASQEICRLHGPPA